MEQMQQIEPKGLGDGAKRFIQGCLWLWVVMLGVVPFNAASTAPEHGLFPLGLLSLLSAGLLLAAWAVLPPVGKWPWSLGKEAAQQERQLKHMRSLAGVQGGIGAALLATIGIFEPDELALSLFTSSAVWGSGAVIYFVAFWGMVLLESPQKDT